MDKMASKCVSSDSDVGDSTDSESDSNVASDSSQSDNVTSDSNQNDTSKAVITPKTTCRGK